MSNGNNQDPVEQHLQDIKVALTAILSLLNSWNKYLRAIYDNIPHKPGEG